MFEPEEKRQDSLVCGFCFNKENKISSRVVRCSAKKLLQKNWQNSLGSACVGVFFNNITIFFLWVFLWFSMWNWFFFFIQQLLETDSASEQEPPGRENNRLGNLTCKHWYMEKSEFDWVYCCNISFVSMVTL